jgi:hypothetical protein
MTNQSAIRAQGAADHFESDIGSVAEYPRFEYSMKDVKRAGEIIAGELPWNDQTAPQIRDAFQIANNWRDAHTYPMRSVRYSLMWFMRHHDLEGVTVARLKRMQAIRRKLRRIPHNLSQLQDLGGCRAILPSIADVRKLVGLLRDRSRHHLRAEDDYIATPKKDGYRSHHLMLLYRGRGAAAVHDDRRIEVQIRTRLQHSWATAVEAVGLFRGEDLKGNHGSGDWLRLFQLMSAEFAVAEGFQELPDAQPRHSRIAEIKDLDKRLDAANILQNMSYAVRWTDIAIAPNDKVRYYLIEFDNASKQVRVIPYFSPKSATLSYDNAESFDNKSGKDAKNIVLVEADKLDNLKAAYPNYFGDVQLFKTQLNNITKGKDVEEYTVKPQETVAPRPRENPDLSWFKRRIRLN